MERKKEQSRIISYTGGNLQTNCYFVKLPSGTALVDAPGDCADWLMAEGLSPDLLLLTHSHFDHVDGAARVVETFGCPVAGHPLCSRMAEEVTQFRALGLEIDLREVPISRTLDEGPSQDILGAEFDIYHVPGHHPASLCFHWKEGNALLGGDVLFAGGIGRFDLPGGDGDLLIKGIREKLLPLDDNILVCPGHGPTTTIGEERASNPFVQ